jgi:hypothetical protein
MAIVEKFHSPCELSAVVLNLVRSTGEGSILHCSFIYSHFVRREAASHDKYVAPFTIVITQRLRKSC